MESSRGGPLTTFIMMLPLIVVPTIAMLRPAGSDGSLLSNLLSAAPEKESTSTPDELADAVFSELPGDDFSSPAGEFSPGDEFADLENQLFAEASGQDDGFAPPRSNTAAIGATISDSAGSGFGGVETGAGNSGAAVSQLLGRLKQMGVQRTLWFNPGDGQFGFVAFFRAGNGIVSYRFEAIATSEPAAIINVMQQAQAWQASNKRP